MSDNIDERDIDTIFNIKSPGIIAETFCENLSKQVKRCFVTDGIAQNRRSQFLIVHKAGMKGFPPFSRQFSISRYMSHIRSDNKITDRFPFQLAHPALQLYFPFRQCLTP
ncbi:hypothetical protein D3C74_457190 [compost metagenome]